MNALQTEADFVGMDADDYAAGQVKKRMKEFQRPAICMVDTAGSAGRPGRRARSGQRSAVPGGTTHSAGWPVREAIMSKSPS